MPKEQNGEQIAEKFLKDVMDNGLGNFFNLDENESIEAKLQKLKKQLGNTHSYTFYNEKGENISEKVDADPQALSEVSYIAKTNVISEAEGTYEPTLETHVMKIEHKENQPAHLTVFAEGKTDTREKSPEEAAAENKIHEDILNRNKDAIPRYKKLRENTKKVSEILKKGKIKKYTEQSSEAAWNQINDRKQQYYERESSKILKKKNAQIAAQTKVTKELPFTKPDGHGNRGTYHMFDPANTPEAYEKNQKMVRELLKPGKYTEYLNDTISGLLINPPELVLPTSVEEHFNSYKKYYDICDRRFLITDIEPCPMDKEIKNFLKDHRTSYQSAQFVNNLIRSQGSKFSGLFPRNLSCGQWSTLSKKANEEQLVQEEDLEYFDDYLKAEYSVITDGSLEELPENENDPGVIALYSINHAVYEKNRLVRPYLKDGEEFDIQITGTEKLDFEQRRDKAAEYLKAKAEGKEPPAGITDVKFVQKPETIAALQQKAKNGGAVMEANELFSEITLGLTREENGRFTEKELATMRKDYLLNKKTPVSDAQNLEYCLAIMDNLDNQNLPKAKRSEKNLHKALKALTLDLENGFPKFSTMKQKDKVQYQKQYGTDPKDRMESILKKIDDVYLAAKEYMIHKTYVKLDPRSFVVYDMAKKLCKLTADMSKSYHKALQYNTNYEYQLPKTNSEIIAQAVMEKIAQDGDDQAKDNLLKWQMAKEQFDKINIASPDGALKENPGNPADVEGGKMLDEKTEEFATSFRFLTSLHGMKMEKNDKDKLIKNLKSNEGHTEETEKLLDELSDKIKNYVNTKKRKNRKELLDDAMTALDDTGTTLRDHQQFKELKRAVSDLRLIQAALVPGNKYNPGRYFSMISSDSGVTMNKFVEIRQQIQDEDYKVYEQKRLEDMRAEYTLKAQKNRDSFSDLDDQAWSEKVTADVNAKMTQQMNDAKTRIQGEWEKKVSQSSAAYEQAAFKRLETILLEKLVDKAAAYYNYVGADNPGKNTRQQNRKLASHEIYARASALRKELEASQKNDTPLQQAFRKKAEKPQMNGKGADINNKDNVANKKPPVLNLHN